MKKDTIMLSGYSINKNGVIHQDNRKPYIYDKNYLLALRPPQPNDTMAFLRLGYIIGSIKEIPSSICDVGYGEGEFLKACAGLIGHRSGIEINGLELPPGCTEGSYSSYYDVITFFDSLEHFPDIDFVKDLNCKYLVVSVPSCNQGENNEWFSKWKHRKPNEHIWHFNTISLSKQMLEYGFELICTTSVEDAIRKSENKPNIVTSVFKRP